LREAGDALLSGHARMVVTAPRRGQTKCSCNPVHASSSTTAALSLPPEPRKNGGGRSHLKRSTHAPPQGVGVLTVSPSQHLPNEEMLRERQTWDPPSSRPFSVPVACILHLVVEWMSPMLVRGEALGNGLQSSWHLGEIINLARAHTPISLRSLTLSLSLSSLSLSLSHPPSICTAGTLMPTTQSHKVGESPKSWPFRGRGCERLSQC
jgi:hypothetical protein